jgi:hypothetical protein
MSPMLWLLMACRPDAASRVVYLTREHLAVPDVGLPHALGAGGDLDGDGRREWAVSVFIRETDYVNGGDGWVRFFEGDTLIEERLEAEARAEGGCLDSFAGLLVPVDFEGDGAPEWVFDVSNTCREETQALWIMPGIGPSAQTEISTQVGAGTSRPTGVAEVSVDGAPAVLVADSHIFTLAKPSEAGLWSMGAENVVMISNDAREAALDVGNAAAVDADGDGRAESWLGGHWSTWWPGEAFVCPAAVGIDLDACVRLEAPGGRVGRVQSAGDLDGDGVSEVATSSVGPGEQGQVHVFRADGELLTTLYGTGSFEFGYQHTFLTDAKGESWLIVTDYYYVYAYHADQLLGSSALIDHEARRMYADAASDTVWHVVTYQPSSSEPAQLVLSSAYSGVFIVDF